MNERMNEWTIKFNQISIVGCGLDQILKLNEWMNEWNQISIVSYGFDQVCKLDRVLLFRQQKHYTDLSQMHQKAIFFTYFNKVKIDTIASNLGFCSSVRTPHLALLYFYVNAAFITSSYSERKNTLKALRETAQTVLFNALLLFYQGYSQGRLFKTNARQKIKDNVCVTQKHLVFKPPANSKLTKAKRIIKSKILS